MLILEIEGPGLDGVEARAIPADVPHFTIGRGAENDLTLADPSLAVSKRHCLIRAARGAIVLEDISTNGTRLDGVTVSRRVATLRQGSIIEIGPYRITITLVEAGDTDAGGVLRYETTRILASLTPREERVLRMRFGIGAEPGHSLEEVGQQFSVTRERIRVIEAKALRKLRHPSRSRKLRSPLDEPGAVQVDEGVIVRTGQPASGAAPPLNPAPAPDGDQSSDRGAGGPTLDLDCVYGDGPSDAAEKDSWTDPFDAGGGERDGPQCQSQCPPASRPSSTHQVIEGDRPPRVQIDYDTEPPRHPFGDPEGSSPAPSSTPQPQAAEAGVSTKFLRRRGRAFFRVPRRMWLEQDELAELRVSPKDIMSVAEKAQLVHTMVGRSVVTDEHDVTRIGRRMRARLHADKTVLRIDSLSSEEQETDLSEALHWNWRITPVRTGRARVTLQVTVLRDAAGRPTTVDAEALHVSVDIAVRSLLTRPRRFLRDNWQWLASSSGGLAAAGAVYAAWRVLSGG